MACSAAVRGFAARVASNTEGIDFAERIVPSLNDSEMQLLKDQFTERRARCRKLGVRERQVTISSRTLRTSLSMNHVPLLVLWRRLSDTMAISPWSRSGDISTWLNMHSRGSRQSGSSPAIIRKTGEGTARGMLLRPTTSPLLPWISPRHPRHLVEGQGRVLRVGHDRGHEPRVRLEPRGKQLHENTQRGGRWRRPRVVHP